MQYLIDGGGCNRICAPRGSIENIPHFPIAPPNPRATIATENNAIYSLETQQRSGEKKQETKIQRYRNVHTVNIRNP